MFKRRQQSKTLQSKIKECTLRNPSINATSVSKLNFIKTLALLDNANIKYKVK
jgi:hypothetical protein